MAQYQSISQYANIIETKTYTRRPLPSTRHRYSRRNSTGVLRRKSSLRRSVRTIFRCCAENAFRAQTIDFLTLTYPEEALRPTRKQTSRHLRDFNRRLRKYVKRTQEGQIQEYSFTGVLEHTKKGQTHFHLLLYNFPHQIRKKERALRAIQHCWERGYIDIRPVKYHNIERLAGYLTKYITKQLADDSITSASRLFFTSDNIHRPRHYSGAPVAEEYGIVDGAPSHEYTYKTRYFGDCTYKKYIKN